MSPEYIDRLNRLARLFIDALFEKSNNVWIVETRVLQFTDGREPLLSLYFFSEDYHWGGSYSEPATMFFHDNLNESDEQYVDWIIDMFVRTETGESEWTQKYRTLGPIKDEIDDLRQKFSVFVGLESLREHK